MQSKQVGERPRRLAWVVLQSSDVSFCFLLFINCCCLSLIPQPFTPPSPPPPVPPHFLPASPGSLCPPAPPRPSPSLLLLHLAGLLGDEAAAGGAAVCQGGGRGSECRQEPVPGAHEPRDPHAHEWCVHASESVWQRPWHPPVSSSFSLLQVTDKQSCYTVLQALSSQYMSYRTPLSSLTTQSSHPLPSQHPIPPYPSGVLGVAELLLRTPLTSEQRQYLDIIRTSGDNLLRIISDVLDLSKIESQSLALEHRPFKLATVVSEALTLLRVVAADKSLQVGTVPHCTAPHRSGRLKPLGSRPPSSP